MSAVLSKLTSAEAVIKAIEECEKLGRDVFLERYGYKRSRLYLINYAGKTYDSKAIAGVAYGHQHGSPLRPRDFSGGAETVIPALSRLGFTVSPTPHPATHLVKGATYFRKDLLELYGGQLQKGIWTPREFRVVFIFSGASGKAYGYSDGWADDGIFQYTGEGQTGDMTFTSGNTAIRDHRSDGKDLLLFEDLGKGKGVRFLGMFECASWDEIEGTDKSEQSRRIIIFNLIAVETAATISEIVHRIDQHPVERTLDELKKNAYAAAGREKAIAKTSEARRSWYERSALVREYVIARSMGVCEACDQSAPFVKKDGTPYLEPHHTTRLADEGPDHPAWVGAICPTCHRRIHSGEDGAAWNRRLQERLQAKESA